MSDTTPKIIPLAEMAGGEEGTTTPEWATRVAHILEGDEQEPEKIKRPGGTFLSACKICDNHTPDGVFAVVAGEDKYQYFCMRCGNLGAIVSTEFLARRQWNMDNAGTVHSLRSISNSLEMITTSATSDLMGIRQQLEEMVSQLRDNVNIISDFHTLVKNITDGGWGEDARIKVNIADSSLTGTLSSDIPETIRIVNSSHNDTARVTEMGFTDISRAIGSLAAAISSMKISAE